MNLEKMIEATQQMDRQVRRIGYGKRRHVHWPEGGHTDEQMAEVDNVTVRRDKTLCKVYVAVKHMAREKSEVTCPKCQRTLGQVSLLPDPFVAACFRSCSRSSRSFRQVRHSRRATQPVRRPHC